ncbi:TPA: S-methyl-5-thioribose kinase, partial [Escherichia coli]|nr:S-methyl-5-thioribose kinase [Escherichia coli]HCU6147227.1 S-methyl-5-thioribose kinase [Escherichia coli]HDN0716328.1 S-methyl-5-thioribose kinase [Escherichia coli]
MTDSIPSGYKPLTCDTLPGYLSSRLIPSCEPGGLPEEWKVSEVGDGNLNMVFIVEGTHKTIIVKQALPWLRAGGEGWPLSLSRAGFEYNVLCQEAKYAGHTLIPQVYFYDPEMALFAMEYLTPHVILRKELINGKKFPKLAEDIGRFLAQTLFNTSDIGMSAEQKKAL